MDDILTALLTALIPATASVIAVIVSNNKNNALQDERISSMKDDIKKLTEKVEQHNNFGIQLAKLETRVTTIEEEIRK